MTLQCMLDELESARLDVHLAPAPHPRRELHCVRIVASRNPTWYRQLCAAHLSQRVRRNPRPDTLIRRRETLRALRRMIAGRSDVGIYGPRLLDVARAYFRRHRHEIEARLAAELAA